MDGGQVVDPTSRRQRRRSIFGPPGRGAAAARRTQPR